MRIPFYGLQADLPDIGISGETEARNVVPGVTHYHPFREPVSQSNSLTSTCLGATAARDASNNVYLYAGTTDKLYEASSDLTFADESKGGGYSTAAGDVWEFVVWDRNQQVIATNFTDPVQAISIGAGASTAFADLITSTNVPKAKHIGIVRNQIVLGNTSDGTDGHQPTRVWWSGVNDATDFDPSLATLSDYETLQQGGWVQRVVGGAEYGVIFQEKLITRMDYVGPPVIYSFNPVDRRRGTHVPNSVVAHGRNIFYYSEEGFFAFGGTGSTEIGSTSIDRTVSDGFDPNDRARVSAAIDPPNKTVTWVIPIGGEKRLFIYRWDTGKWSEADGDDAQILFQAQTPPYTLEELDAVFGSNIDLYTESLDSDTYKGGKYRFASFGSGNKLYYFTGSAKKGYVTTPEFQLSPQRTQINSVRPLSDGANMAVSVGSKTRMNDAVVYGSSSSQNIQGECPLRAEGRYQRIRVSLSGGASASATWSHLIGVEVSDFVQMGGR